MKLAAITSTIVFAGSSAFAGATAYSTQSAPMVADATSMGGTAAWLIPLIAIALIVLASGGVEPPLGCDGPVCV